jgi:hypothetical protein
VNEQDEESCMDLHLQNIDYLTRYAPPAIVHFDGYGVQVETR